MPVQFASIFSLFEKVFCQKKKTHHNQKHHFVSMTEKKDNKILDVCTLCASAALLCCFAFFFTVLGLACIASGMAIFAIPVVGWLPGIWLLVFAGLPGECLGWLLLCSCCCLCCLSLLPFCMPIHEEYYLPPPQPVKRTDVYIVHP